MRTFRLYPRERHWWSFNDYEGVLSVMERLRPRSVLEFGPGSSTLALVEGGAEHVDTCEDEPVWYGRHLEGIVADYPGVVTAHLYQFSDPLVVPGVEGQAFDLALIDGPRMTERRPAVIRYALDRCSAVLVPMEGPPENCYLRPHLDAFAAEAGRRMEIIPTGPLSYAMALLERA